jgi:threonine dehydratase
VEGYGAEITTCEPTSESRVATAAAVEKATPGSVQIASYNHKDVMAGQGKELAFWLSVSTQGSNSMPLSGVAFPDDFHRESFPNAAGTVGYELVGSQVTDLDALIVPVGGGGLLSGICIAAKGLNPNIKIYAAEPLNADDCAQSFAAKERIPLNGPPSTIASNPNPNPNPTHIPNPNPNLNLNHISIAKPKARFLILILNS